MTRRFRLGIDEIEPDGFTIFWKSTEVPKETIIAMLEVYLNKYKESYSNGLMGKSGKSKPF